MKELHNQLLAATDPIEIIAISDKILTERLRRYIKHTFLKGESLLSLGKFDEALSIFEQILEYNDDRFTGRAHNSIGFCYSMKNQPRKAESEFKKARKYCDESSLLLNSATLNMATYYSMTDQKEDAYKIFKELYVLDPSNRFGDSYMLVLMSSNNPQEFIETYDLNIDESFPKDEQVMARKAIALMDLERFEEAIPILDDALKYTDDKEGLKIIHFHLGVSYFRLMELDNAIWEFEKAREYGDDSTILLNLANCYDMANQKEKALETYKELSKREPYNQEIIQKIENLKRENNGKDLLSESNFNSIDEAFLQGNIYWQQEEYEKAIEAFDFITDIMPNHPPSWHNKGFSYYQLGRYEEAMKNFDEALKYNPNSQYSMFYKSSIYMEEGDFENAEDWIVKALMISPNEPQFLNNYIYILTQLGKYEQAIDVANKSLIIEPDRDDIYNYKGLALSNLNRLEEAIECYDKALKINPNNIDVLNSKGVALDNLNRSDEAIECYDKALKINPNYSEVWNNKGFTLNKLNKLDEAIECYDNALKINPNHVEAWTNKGLALSNLNRLDESLECFDKALKINPNIIEIWNNKGFALSNLNRLDESLKCFDNALKINPYDFEVWANKGVVLENSDRIDEAIECYEKALTLSPRNPDILNRLSFIKAKKNGSGIVDLYL